MNSSPPKASRIVAEAEPDRQSPSTPFCRQIPRWIKLVCLLAMFALVLTRRGNAQSMSVPTSAQAELIAKLAGFDRNFSARAGSKALIILVELAGNTESMSAALEMKAALARIPKVGDLPHEERIVAFGGAPALAELLHTQKAAIVYFGPGFDEQIPAIREALSSANVLSVGAVPGYVPAGIVVGFDLVSGRPKLLVHIAQARKQNVSFPGSVLSLMKVHS
jgi:hypothetical protein